MWHQMVRHHYGEQIYGGLWEGERIRERFIERDGSEAVKNRLMWEDCLPPMMLSVPGLLQGPCLGLRPYCSQGLC